MREAARNVQLIRHTYNLVDLPIVMAGKSGTAEFGSRDRWGRLPFHSWFVAFVPKEPQKRADDPRGLKAVARTDSELIVLAFAYELRDEEERCHRDREVLPPAPFRHQGGLPEPPPARARQLLPGRLMDLTFRSTHGWAARPAEAAWRRLDLQLMAYAMLLAALGLAMAYSNSVEAGRPLETGSTFLCGLMWAGIALVAYGVATAFDYRWLRTFAWPLYLVQLGLLVSTLAVGDGVSGASRWVTIGPFVFQFSELAKILMIVVLANYLGSRAGRLDPPGPILGACLLVAPPWLLVMLQPDLGTSLVFAAITAGMLFMSGASLKWLAAFAAGVIAFLPVAWNHSPARLPEGAIEVVSQPVAGCQGAGYQLHQAQIAIGSGGWTGKGLTSSTQDGLDLLPVQTTDFVFAVLAEELGFVGALVLFTLFGALIWRVLVAAWRSRDPFGTLFCCGVAAMIMFQLVRRGLAREPRDRAGDHPEHHHPANAGGVVSDLDAPLISTRPAAWPG